MFLVLYEYEELSLSIDHLYVAHEAPSAAGYVAWNLGKPSREESAVFFNIVQKAFDHPPHYGLTGCPI